MSICAAVFHADEIYSVSDFLNRCQKILENEVPPCHIQGEISNLSKPQSGHIYFSLKDESAHIRCVLFRLNQRHIDFELTEGRLVLVRAMPTIYEARGDFQLVVENIKALGKGELERAFEKLKAELAAAGLFAAAHKKPLPQNPKTVGVVSSAEGAVIRDIIQVLGRRYPLVDILLFDTPVQGAGAADKIVAAVRSADRSGRADVLIVARGGGSMEDLWAFNEAVVARAIFAAKTPIISAVGHETDFTIADMVADYRAPTPSAAAEVAVPDQSAVRANIEKIRQTLGRIVENDLSECWRDLEKMTFRLVAPERRIYQNFQRLDELSLRLNQQIGRLIHGKKNRAAALSSQMIQNSPNERLLRQRTRADFLQKSLSSALGFSLAEARTRFSRQVQMLGSAMTIRRQHLAGALDDKKAALKLLSPLAVLARGYSITTHKGRVAKIENIARGETIETRLAGGFLASKIEKIDRNRKQKNHQSSKKINENSSPECQKSSAQK